MTPVRLARTLLALVVVALAALAFTGGAPAAQAKGADSTDGSDGTDTTSAVTVSGTGRFSDVAVTVDQTEHLVNQVVHVSWAGAKQTSPKVGAFDRNYMQLMQCWGDGAAPKREDCQFGGFTGDSRGGEWVASRQVTYGANLVDPSEPIKRPEGTFKNLSVPFDSVKGDSTTDFPNPYFDQYSTNEETFARTGADGRGQDFFEVQTGQQAPGLGCGQRLPDGSPRACWLVVVPRDGTEVDGTVPDDRVRSSPLSTSNWDNAIAIRLHFAPIGVSCPIGADERRLLGQEEVAEAIVRWQPVLCQETGSIFGFSQISDDLSRQQAMQADPWLSFVTKPVEPDTIPDGRKLTYAPVALDGLGIGYNLDKDPDYGSPDSINSQAGQRIQNLRLNARLVAKLLTQSYRVASFLPSFPSSNAGDLGSDPEFRKLNPSLNGFDFSGVYQITVPEGLSDAYNELWRWIESDKDAKAFVNGKPDPWGGRVNPLYKGISLDNLDSFPRADLNCKDIAGGLQLPLCPLDKLAYAQDMHDGTRSAAHGDTLARNFWDIAAIPPQYKKQPPQLSGVRKVLTLTETATAARFSIPMALLQNAAGNFVAPTDASILRGLASMKPTVVDGVLRPDPAATGADVYPLPHLAYAVTAPALLDKGEAKDYASFLRYIVGKGQAPGISPGQLPAGYVPLTPSLVDQAEHAADLIAKRAGATPTPSPTDTATTPADTGSDVPVGTPTPASAPPAGDAPVAAPTGGPTAAAVAPQTQSVSFTTPSDASGALRFALVGALVLGLIAALVRPALFLVRRWRPVPPTP
ncbi:MAG: hypothetical protein ACJ72L_06395 [Marmoricola sp.]